MFVRFVVPVQGDCSHCLTGVFQAADGLRDLGLLGEDERRWFEQTLRWFNRHLPVPTRFSRSRRPHACPKTVCWFKDDAAVFLGRVRERAALLGRRRVRYSPGRRYR